MIIPSLPLSIDLGVDDLEAVDPEAERPVAAEVDLRPARASTLEPAAIPYRQALASIVPQQVPVINN